MNRMTAAAGSSFDDLRLSASERAYRDLKQLILDNELGPGLQLLEQEAAARLGMSRTPVREAMVRLEQEGMVEIRPRHGMRVLPISADSLADIYEILTALEGAAAEAAARKGASAEEILALKAAVADMDAALAADDLPAWSRADSRFHKLLVALSGNSRLAALVDQVSDQAYRARTMTLRLRPKPVDSNKDHAAVVQAIVNHDPAAARAIHERHRREAAVTLVGIVRSMGLR